MKIITTRKPRRFKKFVSTKKQSEVNTINSSFQEAINCITSYVQENIMFKVELNSSSSLDLLCLHLTALSVKDVHKAKEASIKSHFIYVNKEQRVITRPIKWFCQLDCPIVSIFS